MKKIMLIVLGLWLMVGLVHGKGIRIEVKGSYFSSENGIFRDVYGSAAKFGLEGGVDIEKRLALGRAGLSAQNGGLTVSEEETRVWLTPLTLGVRYEIPAGNKLRFHVAAGVQEVFFQGRGISRDGEGKCPGVHRQGWWNVSAGQPCQRRAFPGLVDVQDDEHEDVEFKVGGLDLGVGVEIRF